MHARGIRVACFQQLPVVLAVNQFGHPSLLSIQQIRFYFLLLGTLSPKSVAVVFNG